MFNQIIRNSGLLRGGVLALACFVFGVLALSLNSPMAAACGAGGCGSAVPNAPTTATCAVTGGGFVTVTCTGAKCPSGHACGKCDVYDSQGNVVSCGCACHGCVNCGLGDDPPGGGL